MGAVNSCNCTKDGEKNELDLMKEQKSQRPLVTNIKSARETNNPQSGDVDLTNIPVEGNFNFIQEKMKNHSIILIL